MPKYVGYEKILQDELGELLITNRPIVLFGTLSMGDIAKKALDFLNIKPACFCDNNKERQGMLIDEAVVLSVEQVKEEYPNASIFICSYNEDNVRIMREQLQEMNFESIKRSDVLFYIYQTKVMKREISSSDLAETMHVLNTKNGTTVLNTVSVSLTEKCSLRCENCAAFIPYYENPINYNKETIINSIKIFSQSVDAIDILTMFGGEPLLHSDLIEICTEASKLKNVKRVQLITNGTLLPSLSIFESLSSMVMTIHISNYGALSTKKDEISMQCKKNGIILEIDEEDSMWSKLGDLIPYNRTEAEKKTLFGNCWRSSKSNLIIDGEFYLCSMSAFGTKIGIVPKKKEDYVDLVKQHTSHKEIKNQLYNLINNTEYLNACDYCEIILNHPTPAAQQVKGVIKLPFNK